MKSLAKICITITILWAVGSAQEPNVVWTRTYGGSMGDKGYSVSRTQDGGCIIAGETYSFGAGNTDVYLVKVDCMGNQQWHKWFGTANYDNAQCIQQTTDGEYIVAGAYNNNGISDIYLIKVYSNGNLHWWKHIGTTAYDEWGHWVEQTIDNGFIVVGGQMALAQQDVFLFKTDTYGNVEWSQIYGGNQMDIGFCVQQTIPDHGYIITGLTSSFGAGAQIWLIKTDEYGSHQWDKIFGYADWDEGRCVRQTFPDRGYIIAGTLRSQGIFMGLIKVDASGNLLWEKRLRPSPNSVARGYSVKQTTDGGYIAVGEAMLTNHWDTYVVKLDKDGNLEWQKVIDRAGRDDHGYAFDLIGSDSYIIAGASDIAGAWYDIQLIKLGLMLNDTDDSLALAYNGNRHLVRHPSSEAFHLVYTRENKVIYQYSTNGGTNWTSPSDIGIGKLPAITLNSGNLPSVTWTDDIGGLWYRRQTAPGVWGETYHLYDPWGIFQPKLNAPLSIVITPHATGDSVHILCTMHNPANQPINRVAVYSFHINDPMNGSFAEIEGGAGQYAGAIRYNPSIAKNTINNSLHAVWQRADTICYATRQIGQQWQNWGPRFEDKGILSAHPFVECYGDMVYVVWEHKESPGAPEEAYKGKRRLDESDFSCRNLSRTPESPSRYPVNASGLFTVFQDSPWPPINGPEIYYKVHPEDEPYNISQTISGSYYPQSVARIIPTRSYLYAAWLDGDAPPYEIRFKKLPYIPIELPAYLTSNDGYETPSSYLVQRDSFISTWQVPVDVGYQTIKYRFPLEPGYRYIIKVIGYHESSGQWREWVRIDGKLKHLIKYNAYEPETLEFWIPPAYYQDGRIDVVFERISGNFATAGPIEIYQYEYEEGEGEMGGPMAQESQLLNNAGITIFPNPFKDRLVINLTAAEKPLSDFGNSLSIKIYDVAGRLIKQYNNPAPKIVWNGDDEYGRHIPAGVYFLTVDNPDAKQTFCHKIIKLE